MILTEYFPVLLTDNQLNEAVSITKGPLVFRHILFQRANAKNRNGRVYPKSVLEPVINRYNEDFVKTRRALGELDHCFTDSDFDVLTESGWKPFLDVKVGENVLSYNINTRNYEYKKVLRVINSEYEGDSYTIKGKHIDTQVTSGHRFILEERYGKQSFETIDDIYNNRTKYNRYKIIKTGNFVSKSPDTIILKGVPKRMSMLDIHSHDIEIDTKVFAGILGFWLADGSISRQKGEGGNTKFHQNEGEKLDEFLELLNQTPFEYYITSTNREGRTGNQKTVIVKNHQLFNYVKNLGDRYTKYIPQEVKNFNRESLEYLLHFFNLGDGRCQVGKHGTRRNVFTVSYKLIEDLQECLIKVGGSGNFTIAHKAGREGGLIEGRKIVATKDLHQLNFSTVSGIYLDDRFVKIEKIHHKGNKYCLEVEDNQSFCVRQRNKYFITGNCQSMVVELKNVSHLITEMHWEGDEVYGDVEILDTPSGKILTELALKKIPFGISSRAQGSVNETPDAIMVQDDLELLCFDAVSFESTQGSTLALHEGYNIQTGKYERVDSIIHHIICSNTNFCPCKLDKK